MDKKMAKTSLNFPSVSPEYKQRIMGNHVNSLPQE